MLDSAADAFARRGYEGASIADLTAAMGISAQSLYAAFGSKAALYCEVLDHYADTAGTFDAAVLSAPDPLTTLGALLQREARRFAKPSRAPGCLISTGLLGCSDENRDVARAVARRREAALASIRELLHRGQLDGEVNPDTDPDALARFIGAIVQGMSVQAHDGASVETLEAIAQLAINELARHRIVAA